MGVKVIIVIALFAIAVGGAVTLAVMEGGTEYRTIPDLTGSNYDGRRVKVKGQVIAVQSPFKPAQFTCIDIPPEGQLAPENAAVIQVIYEGDDVPANLKRAAHVTMTGRFDSARGAFIATELQTQCPSRYEGKELTTANEAVPSP